MDPTWYAITGFCIGSFCLILSFMLWGYYNEKDGEPFDLGFAFIILIGCVAVGSAWVFLIALSPVLLVAFLIYKLGQRLGR